MKPNKNYRVYNILNNSANTNNSFSLTSINENIPTATSLPQSTEHVNIKRIKNTEKPVEVGNKQIKQPIEKDVDDSTPVGRSSAVIVQRIRKVSKSEIDNESEEMNSEAILPQHLRVFSTSSSKNVNVTVTKVSRSNTVGSQPSKNIDANSHDLQKNQRNIRIPSNPKIDHTEVMDTGDIPAKETNFNPSVKKRSSSISSVNVRKVKRSATNTQSIASHPRSNTFSTNNRSKAPRKVTVVKVHRKRTRSS
jgi:hypothetical protein